MVNIEVARRRLAGGTTAAILAGISLTPKTVNEALTALETVASRLQESERALAAFPDIYGIVTRKIVEQVRRHDGIFLEPRWISRLAGRFCERYLDTLRGWLERRPQDCDAWTATYACSTLPVAVPGQHVLLGLSAHINFDLALGIYQTILEFGHASNPEMLARYKHDYDEVNALLLVSMPEAFERLSTHYGCAVSGLIYSRVYSPARWLIMKLLIRWRAVVWANVCALLAARTAEERGAVIARMARRSGLYGRIFKLPSDIASAPCPLLEPPRSRLAEVIPLPRPAKVDPCARRAKAPRSRERMCA